jgi:hypothetical protein
MWWAWVPLMKPYYKTFDMVMCPAAIKKWSDMENWSDPLAAWDFTVLAGEITMKEFQDVPYFAAMVRMHG